MDEERIKKLVRELLIELGEDPTREGLAKTPERMANAYREIFSGYDSDSELSVQFSEDSEVVVVRDIQFYSMCEHHMLPFFGKIQLAYSPNGRAFGISKLVRLVEKYSRRLQIQERMTKRAISPEETNSANLDIFCTSSLPYFDGLTKDRTSAQPDLVDEIDIDITV